MDEQEQKIKTHMTVLLTGEPEDDILKYVKSLKTEEDFEEFLEDIVDPFNSKHLAAKQDLKKVLLQIDEKPKLGRNHNKNYNAVLNSTSAKKNVHAESNKSGTKVKETPLKGKKKFQDIKAFKEKEKIKEGRVECNCHGQVHAFMNNCLNCGRIHCMDEGPGPCLFCGQMINATGANFAQDIGENSSFKPQANTIYDDDNDYFKIGKNNDKSKKKSMVVALDFATRRVIESSEEDEKIRKKILEDSKKHLRNVEILLNNLQKSQEFKPVVNVYEEMGELLISMRHIKPPGKEELGEENGEMPKIEYKNKSYDETFDHGVCLSMHQPYASLLIAGVKKHEGRNWPTNHIGPLWIAAASKQPESEEVEVLENFYRQYYNEPSLKFPSTYPTSCLLGFVNVQECLSQENYRKLYPNGESDSPYVLICSNPVILPIFYPIVGKHKIYPLEKDLHKCAKMCLRYAKFLD